MASPIPTPTASYLNNLAQTMNQAWGLSMHSSFLGGEITPDENSQTMLEYWIHALQEHDSGTTNTIAGIDNLTARLQAEKDSAGQLSAASLNEVADMLESLGKWSFSSNGILEEAWERSILRTRSGQTYAKVGSKFADNYKSVLKELAKSSPQHAQEALGITDKYVNKHHLMLKSLHANLQIVHGNLLHAGLGSAATGNSELHKAMHRLTALNGKLDYAKMDPQMAVLISQAVTKFSDSPGHKTFNQ